MPDIKGYETIVALWSSRQIVDQTKKNQITISIRFAFMNGNRIEQDVLRNKSTYLSKNAFLRFGSVEFCDTAHYLRSQSTMMRSPLIV